MRKPKKLQKLQSLLRKPSFTAQEAKVLGISSSLLCHYVKTKRLKRLGHGIYQNSNYQIAEANFQWEDLITVLNSIPKGVVCLISALSLYNLTDEIPRKHWIAIPHGTSIKRSKEVKILRFRDMELGKTEIDLNGINIPIFDRERTIVDAFRLLSLEVAIKALKMSLLLPKKQQIDLKKLKNYAKKNKVNIIPYLITTTT